MNLKPACRQAHQLSHRWLSRVRTLVGGLALAGFVLLLSATSVVHAQTGGAPHTPDAPTGSALWAGMVGIRWDGVPGADSYEVQYFHISRWVDLPAEDEGIDILVYGEGAVVTGLPMSTTNTFRVRAVNSHGASGWSDYGWFPQTDLPGAWAGVPKPANVAATGAPSIMGTLARGELLTVDVSAVSDDNGLDGVRFHYQWILSDGTTDTEIDGATGESYTAQGEEGSVKVRVSFSDMHGFPESLTSAAKSNSAASGAPTIRGTARVGEVLTVDTSGIQDEDGFDSAGADYQWMRRRSWSRRGYVDILGATNPSYVPVCADRLSIKVRVTFTDGQGNRETLTSASIAGPWGGSLSPLAVEVEVTDVPIVVPSTEEDYFVLYARHDAGSGTVEYPVRVTLGEEGTTTLSEAVRALPADRYRVEKYRVDRPGDVDGDCIDDITELNRLGAMNPVNPGALESRDGSVAVTDLETFKTLSISRDGAWHTKFHLDDLHTGQPVVYIQNVNTHAHHYNFLESLRALGGQPRTSPAVDGEVTYVKGDIDYDPDLIAPDGSRGVYSFKLNRSPSLRLWERAYTLLAASMPVLDDDLALYVANRHVPDIQADLLSDGAFRARFLLQQERFGDLEFLALNPGEGYGLLRQLDPDERPGQRDVVIYETLPNDLPRVAGVISTVPQTPLSHVNLRALQEGVPNAFIRDALGDESISGLVGSHVYYAVTDAGYTLRAASQSEVEQHYASSRPAEAQTPERDLTVTSITPLGDVGFDDWDAFGIKAANVAVLGTLGFPEGTVPDGFAVPFYFYDEFMKHNDLYDDVEEMLTDPDFQTDDATKQSELKKLRKRIKKAETPAWIETALTGMHAAFPEGTSLRYRSSTNNEDLPGFNGAGLYDSKTQHPEETEEDGISKSLKQVYASLWNYRAFIERDFHRIDHMATAMGVLVHPNYSDELVNGVAVSTDPGYGTEGTYYVNSQLGEDLVTNPEAHSLPEETLLNPDGTYSVVALSNQVREGQLLMTADQMAQLRRHLATVHEKFAQLYGIEDGERFAMEIEFKITSDNILAIKQARPWLFSDRAVTGGASDALTASTEGPATHTGANVRVRVLFSDNIRLANEEFRNHSIEVIGGDVEDTGRVNRRHDLFWISVVPHSGHEDVTVVLAAGRDCRVVGAVCTSDGRRLSNRVEHTVRAANAAATGAPAVSGTPRVGETLSADTSGIADGNGLDNVTFSYQWLSDGGAIEGATGPTYVLVPANAGKTMQVRVDFSDDAGNEETLTSAATRAVEDAAVEEPVWEATLTPGEMTGMLPAHTGYSAFRSLGGTLAPGMFERDGVWYFVDFLIHDGNGLYLGLGAVPSDDFVLQIGNLALVGSESTSPVSGAAAGFFWPEPTPGWTAGEPVDVSLRFTDQALPADRDPAPLFARFIEFPQSHDGSHSFTLTLSFSDVTVATVGEITRRLEVHNGELLEVVETGERVGLEGMYWLLTVRPDAGVDVGVVMPAGTDCSDTGAVCTADGRMLSSRIELTIRGPGAEPDTGPGSPVEEAPVGVDPPGAGETPTDGTTGVADEAGPTEPPSPPLNLTAVANPDGSITLSWAAPEDGSVTGYQILRRRPREGEDTLLVYEENTGTTATTYNDSSAPPGTLYVYRVKAINEAGTSVWSDYVNIEP